MLIYAYNSAASLRRFTQKSLKWSSLLVNKSFEEIKEAETTSGPLHVWALREGLQEGTREPQQKWKSKVSRLKGIRHLLFSNNKWLSWKISKLLECTEAKSKKREKCLTSFHVKMLALFFLLDGSRGIFTFFGMCLLFLELNWYFFLTFISSFACLFFHYLLYSFLSLRELFSFSSPSCNLSYLVPVRYFFYLFFLFLTVF